MIWKGKTNMKITSVAPKGAIFMSNLRRTLPLNYLSADAYLEEYNYKKNGDIDEQEIFDDASDLAAELYTSCCDKLCDLFLAFEADADHDNTYGLIEQIYAKWNEPVPMYIRAFAAIPEVWEVFVKMTADELEIYREGSDEGGEDE